jgi:hypothetical protein
LGRAAFKFRAPQLRLQIGLINQFAGVYRPSPLAAQQGASARGFEQLAALAAACPLASQQDFDSLQQSLPSRQQAGALSQQSLLSLQQVMPFSQQLGFFSA